MLPIQMRTAEQREGDERRAGAEVLREHQAERDADDRRDGERGHDRPHRGAAAVVGEHVADDGHDGRSDDAAEQPGHGAGDDERLIRWGEPAEQCANGEAEIEGEQGGLAAEPVEELGREERADERREAVDGHGVAELLGRDAEVALRQRGERHDDDEVEDVGELDGGKKEEQAPLAAGDGGLRSRGGVAHFRSQGSGDRGQESVSWRRE